MLEAGKAVVNELARGVRIIIRNDIVICMKKIGKITINCRKNEQSSEREHAIT